MARPFPEFRPAASAEEEPLDFSKAQPPPLPSVGFFSNLYRGAKRGVIADLPEMVGKGAQALGDDHGTLEQFGKGIRASAEARGQRPDLRTDSMWGEGAAAFGPMLPVIGATLAGGMVGGPIGAMVGATAGAMGLFGTSAFQETKEKVLEAGGTPEEAKSAGLKSGFIQGAGEAAATLALGPGANIARGMVRAGLKGGVEGTLKQFAKPSTLKDLGKFAAVEYPSQVSTEVLQDYGQAKVEQAYGVDVNPYEVAKQSAGPAFAMTTLMGPFAMGSIHRTNQRRQQLLSTINDPAVGKDDRSRALMEIYQDIKPVDPSAAVKWRLDAEVALNAGKPVDVTDVETLAQTAREVKAEQRLNATPTMQLIKQSTGEPAETGPATATERIGWKQLLQQNVPGYLPNWGQEPPTEAEQRDIDRVVQGPNFQWEQPGLFTPEQLAGVRVVKAPPAPPVTPDQQTLGDKFAAPAAPPPAAPTPSRPARTGAAPFKNEQEARMFRAWDAWNALPLEERQRRMENPDARAQVEALADFVRSRIDTQFGQDLASQAMQLEQEAQREEQGQRERLAAFEQMDAARMEQDKFRAEQAAQDRARAAARGKRVTLRGPLMEAGVPEAVARARAGKQMQKAEGGFLREEEKRGAARVAEKVEAGVSDAEIHALPISAQQVMDAAAPALKKAKLENAPLIVQRQVMDALQKRNEKGELYRGDQVRRLNAIRKGLKESSVGYGYVSTYLDTLRGLHNENPKVDQGTKSQPAAQPSAAVNPAAAPANVQGNAPPVRSAEKVAQRGTAKVAEGIAATVERGAKREAMESTARGVLDDMEEKNESPRGVAEKFWSNTYFKLPAEGQARFRKLLKEHSGGRSEDLAEVANLDLPEQVAGLEGTERGFVALMREANARFGQAEQQPAPAAKQLPAKVEPTKEKASAADTGQVTESRQPEREKGNGRGQAAEAGGGNRTEQRKEGNAPAKQDAAKRDDAKGQVVPVKATEVPAAKPTAALAEPTALEKRQKSLERVVNPEDRVAEARARDATDSIPSNLPRKKGETNAQHQQRVARAARKLIAADRKGKTQRRLTSGPAPTLIQQTQDRVAELAKKRTKGERRQTAEELRREHALDQLTVIAARHRGLKGDAALDAAAADADILANLIYKRQWQAVARAATNRQIDLGALRIATGYTKIEKAGTHSADAKDETRASKSATRREERDAKRKAEAKQALIEEGKQLGPDVKRVEGERERVQLETSRNIEPYEYWRRRLTGSELLADTKDSTLSNAGNEIDELVGKRTRYDYGEPLVGALNTNLAFSKELDKANGDVNALLDWARTAEELSPLQRVIARQLRKLGLTTEVVKNNVERGSHFYPNENRIVIGIDGHNALTFLHEAVHAATARVLNIAQGNIEGALTAAQRRAAKELDKLWNEYARLQNLPDGTTYAAKDVFEFVAEAHANPKVQELLKSRAGGNLWQRFVNAVRRAVGLPIKYNELDRVLSLSDRIMSNQRARGPQISLQREAAASPAGLISALGRSITEHSKIADKLVQSAGKADLPMRARKAILQVVSLNHMEEWSMRQVERWKQKFAGNETAQKALEGFSKAITKFFDAVGQKRQVKQGLDQESSSLLRQMRLLDRETREYAVPSLGRRMTEFQMLALMGPEASRLGIDPSLQTKEQAKTAGVSEKYYDSQYTRPEVKFLFEIYNQLQTLHKKRSPDISDKKMFETDRVSAAVPKSGYELYKLSAKLNELRYYQELSTQVRNMLRALDTNVYDEYAKRLDIRGGEQQYEVPLEGIPLRIDSFKQALHDLGETIGGKNDKLLQSLEGEYQAEEGEDRTTFEGWKAIAEKWEERYKAQAKKQEREFTTAEKAQMERVQRDVNLLNTAGVLRANLNTIRAQVRERSMAPYFHLGRSGDYFVALRVADKPGAWEKVSKVIDDLGYVSGPKTAKADRTVFLRFDSRQELALAAAKFNTVLDQTEPDSFRQGALEEKLWELDAADVLFVKRLQESVNEYRDLPSETKNAMKRLINDTLIRLVPESSPRKSNLHREGRPGYNANLLHTYAMRQSAHNHVISTYYSAPQFDDAFGTMRESIKGFERNPDGAVSKIAPQLSAYETEMKERYSNLLSPVDSPVLDKVRAFGHFWFLALSPAYTATNMLQPWHLTLPYYGGRYGFVNSFKALARASRVSMAILKETVKQGWQGDNWFEKMSNVSDARLIFEEPLRKSGIPAMQAAQYARLIAEAMQSGQLSFSQSAEIGRLAKNETGPFANMLKIATLFGYYSETFNRLTTLIAGFDLAGGRSGNHDARQAYARKGVSNTQLDYSDANVARAFGRHGLAGPVTPLASSFQHYSFGVTELLARLAIDSVSGPNAVSNDLLMTKAEARKSLAQLFLTTSVISGVFGLPFASVAFWLANMFDDDDEPVDAKTKVRNAFAGLFGKETGEVLSHGVGRALGFEISERTGLHDLIPGSRFLADRRQTADAAKEGMMRMLGPAISGMAGAYQGVEALLDGDYAKAVQNALPVALRNPAKAAVLAQRGVENRTSNDIPVQLSDWDIFMQALGFTPAKKAEASAAAFQRRTEDMLLKQRQASLRNKITRAYEDGDWASYFPLLDQMQQFERTNPDYGMDIKRGLEARAKQRAVAETGAAPILDLPKFAPRLERYSYANTR